MSIPTTPRRTRATLAITVAALLLPAAAAGAAESRMPQPKSQTTRLTATSLQGTIDLRLAAGSEVQLRGGRLVAADGTRLSALDGVLGRFPGTRVEPMFAGSTEQELAQAERAARALSRRPQVDLGLFFRIRTNAAETARLLDALNGLEMVEVATPAAKPTPPPVTPSFVSRQGYRSAASAGGIDAEFAQALAGGKGENATIVDIEYSWNRAHEDLSKTRAAGSAVANGTPCDPFAAQGPSATDHGTAVLGELAGDPNGSGVTGLAPGARIRTVNASSRATNGTCVWNVANAILVAAANTAPGDVILIEQQTSGPNRTDPRSDVGYVPVEWDQSGAVWAAIRNATDRGRIVVEAAGNGYQNLDSTVYNDRTGRNWFSYDSGAILVGAGNAPGCSNTTARGRLSFSNYGSRLNVQAWGNCVTTTGYGNLQGVSGGNTAYTWSFSGTSSASPIVAAAAGVLSSIAESRGRTLTPATVRSTLRSTGQPQTFGNAGAIGPLPNLRAAIATVGGSGPRPAEASHVIGGTNLSGTTVPVRQSWTNSGSAAVGYEVWLSTDGGAFVKQAATASAATFNLERNHNYRFAARAVDAAGIWSAFAYGTTFHVGEYQENYTSAIPAFSGTWTRAAWQRASDGFVSLSGAAGSRATFSFTGSNVAWIATKANNRGQARVYVDGVLARTVDLYSATTSAQAVAFSRTWPQPGAHTITVEVVGTAGRPKVDVDAFVRLR